MSLIPKRRKKCTTLSNQLTDAWGVWKDIQLLDDVLYQILSFILYRSIYCGKMGLISKQFNRVIKHRLNNPLWNRLKNCISKKDPKRYAHIMSEIQVPINPKNTYCYKCIKSDNCHIKCKKCRCYCCAITDLRSCYNCKTKLCKLCCEKRRIYSGILMIQCNNCTSFMCGEKGCRLICPFCKMYFCNKCINTGIGTFNQTIKICNTCNIGLMNHFKRN